MYTCPPQFPTTPKFRPGLRANQITLPEADYDCLKTYLKSCEQSTADISNLLAYVLSAKLMNTEPLAGPHHADFVTGGCVVTYSVNGAPPRTGLLVHEATPEPVMSVIPLASLLGAALIGMRAGQRAPLLRENGTIHRLLVISVEHSFPALTPSKSNPNRQEFSKMPTSPQARIKPAKRSPKIVINADDLAHLEGLADGLARRNPDLAERLLEEISRARIVAPAKMPADVVTMGSTVTYRDETTAQEKSVTLVYPEEADIAQGRVSVITPVGVALLGLATGASFYWDTRGDERRTLTVIAVAQPVTKS